MTNTEHLNLYKWEESDTKKETIKEMSANSQKIDDEFKNHKARLSGIDKSINEIDTAIDELKPVVEEALSTANDLQGQLDAVIGRETDSDAMSRQAAINADGVDKGNLKARLDDDFNKVSEHLAERPTKEDVFLKTYGININDLDEPTRQAFLEAQGIDVNYVLGEDNVKPINTSFFKSGKNLLDLNAVTAGYLVSYSTGEIIVSASHISSPFIKVNSHTNYIKSKSGHVAFYDKNKNYLSGLQSQSANVSFSTPENCVYARFSFTNTGNENLQIEEGNQSSPHENYKAIIPRTFIEAQNNIVINDTNTGIELKASFSIVNGHLTLNYEEVL